jgi:hypothetical protein
MTSIKADDFFFRADAFVLTDGSRAWGAHQEEKL